MLQALLPALDDFAGPFAVALGAYVVMVLALMWMAAAGSLVRTPYFVAPRRSMPLPGILCGVAVGVIAVQMLPSLFPGADFAEALRQGALAVRGW